VVMKIILRSPKFRRQYDFWLETHPSVCKRIDSLISDILIHPFSDLGSLEKLERAGKFYSRRIQSKHRLVHSLDGECLNLISCRGHYDDH
jgi:toxin YoeB